MNFQKKSIFVLKIMSKWKYLLTKMALKVVTPENFSVFGKILVKLSFFLEFLVKRGKRLPEVEFFS